MIQQAVQAVADTSLRAEVFSRIDAIGAKLGVAANHLWPVLVRQSYADAAIDLVLGTTFALVAFRCYSWLPGLWKKSDGDDVYFMGVCLSTLGLVAATVAVVVCLSQAAGRFINPEYYALQSVLDVLRGK